MRSTWLVAGGALVVLAGTAWMASAQTVTPAAPESAAPTSQPASPVGQAAKSTAATNEPVDPFEQWVRDSKNPVPWFKWGFDVRLRNEYHNNAITLDKNAAGHEWNFQRYRERVWATFSPCKDVDINTRIVYEPRHYCLPDSKPDWVNNEASFDNLNVVWRNIGGQPLKLTVGRQDILDLGNGWLVLDGTPLDGSRTTYFDAIRATYEFKDCKTTVDMIYIDQTARSDRWIEPICDKRLAMTDQNERGAILWVNNKQINWFNWDLYYIWKNDMLPDFHSPNSSISPNQGDTHAFGARASGALDEHWRYRAEFAEEVGHKNGDDLCAFGFNSQLSYWFNDPLNNRLRAGYEFLSGDDPGTGKNEQFDLLWGRWPQWSELYVYTVIPESGGRPADISNLHRIQFGHSFNPCKAVEIATDYHLLFADESNRSASPMFSGEGKFRGQLATCMIRHKISEHINHHVLFELFAPGNYYSEAHNDVATYLRYEIMFTW